MARLTTDVLYLPMLREMLGADFAHVRGTAVEDLRAELRARFNRGQLVAERVDRRMEAASLGALGLATMSLPDEPPLASAQEEATTTWFSLTVVDEWGRALDDLEVEVVADGKPRKLRTNDSGNVRIDDAHRSLGSARFVNAAAVREKLRGRKIPRADIPLPQGPNVQVEVVRADMAAVQLESERPLVLVLRREHVRVRLVGMYFETNKSFLLPTAMQGIRGAVEVFERNPHAKLLVVGHTDTVADEKYNLDLSVERADAVAAYFTDDVDAWLRWFADYQVDWKRWGAREEEHMLCALPEGLTPFYDGKPSGKADAKHREAVTNFQLWSNAERGTALSIDGKAGLETRRALVQAYMALQGTSLSGGAKPPTHGCGEYFPEDPTGDNVEDEQNRRVEIFYFDGAIGPPPPGKTSKRGSTEYPEWRKQILETFDFRHDGLTVLVLSPTGVPLTEAVVRCVGPVNQSTRTAADGLAHFVGLADGTYRISVRHDEWDEDERVVVIPRAAASMTSASLEDEAAAPGPGAASETPEVVVVTTPNYWEYGTLEIPETGVADPARGSPLFNKFIRQVKNDLRLARYLDKSAPDDPAIGPDLSFALQRFKRAAARIFRVHMSETAGDITRPAGKGFDVLPADTFVLPIVGGQPTADARIDARLAKELHERWFREGWVRPVGRFRCVQGDHDVSHFTTGGFGPPPYCDPKNLKSGFRADITAKFNAICAKADAVGATLWGPYGDTGVRPVGVMKPGGGSSPRSRHFFGLAVDLQQHKTSTAWTAECGDLNCLRNRSSGGKAITTVDEARVALASTHQRYVVQAIDEHGVAISSPGIVGTVTTFWTIWCRVDNAIPGVTRTLGPSSSERQVVFSSPIAFASFPPGEYVDLSQIIEADGHFTRIQAHDDFINKPVPYNHTEWWHFSACIDSEVPFSKKFPFRYSNTARVIDMADLVGFSETYLRAHAIDDAAMEKTTA